MSRRRSLNTHRKQPLLTERPGADWVTEKEIAENLGLDSRRTSSSRVRLYTILRFTLMTARIDSVTVLLRHGNARHYSLQAFREFMGQRTIEEVANEAQKWLRSLKASLAPPRSLARCKKCRAAPPDDGIRVAEVYRIHPNFPKGRGRYGRTSSFWCHPDPLLGRCIAHGRNFKSVLSVSRRDVDEHMEIVEHPLNRELPGNKGVWIAIGIYKDEEGIHCTANYLEAEYPKINFLEWYNLSKSRHPCQDQAVNGGKIRNQLVLWPCPIKRQGIMKTVFHSADVNTYIAWRGLLKSKDRPTSLDQWENDGLCQTPNGLCATISWLTEKFKRPNGWWRSELLRKPHPALNPDVNGGQMRQFEVLKPYLSKSPGGAAEIAVCLFEDAEKAATFYKANLPALTERPGVDWVTEREIADHFGLDARNRSSSRVRLNTAIRFARKTGRINGVTVLEKHGNTPLAVQHYSLRAFRKFMGQRTIKDVANEAKKFFRNLEARGKCTDRSPAGDGGAGLANPIPLAALDRDVKPRWDDEQRKLFLGEKLLKSFGGHPANNQIELITAFHLKGWPPSVVNPFEDSTKLKATRKVLNRALPPGTIKFRGDGAGDVRWVLE